MNRLTQFVESKLTQAEYEYDPTVKQWAGWIRGLPGIYGQARSVELVRRELAEMLEDYVFVSLKERKPIKGFAVRLPSVYAKTR